MWLLFSLFAPFRLYDGDESKQSDQARPREPDELRTEKNFKNLRFQWIVAKCYL